MKKICVLMACVLCLTCCSIGVSTSRAQEAQNTGVNTAQSTSDLSNNLYCADPGEKPLDNVLTDGGYTSIFRKIACIGDSLSSGEFEAVNSCDQTTYHDMYEYSWGQFMARMCGSTVYNFSRGGMTAQYYCDTFATENGYWDSENAAQAYIIALGVNDLARTDKVGSTADVDLKDWHNNTKNFAGYYAQIIQRIKEVQPRAKIFLVTFTNGGENDAGVAKKEAQRNLLYDFSKIFDNTYVIDLYRYGPAYDDAFRDQYFMGAHMNPMGYKLTAQLVSSYIDYIIRHNMNEFKEVGFIGTDLHG